MAKEIYTIELPTDKVMVSSYTVKYEIIDWLNDRCGARWSIHYAGNSYDFVVITLWNKDAALNFKLRFG